MYLGRGFFWTEATIGIKDISVTSEAVVDIVLSLVGYELACYTLTVKCHFSN